MVFNIKTGKVNEDGSITDGNTTIKQGEDGYYLLKARIEAGGKFPRKVMSDAEMKAEKDKKSQGTFKRVKLSMKLKGYDVDRSGYRAMMTALEEGVLNMEKVFETLETYNNKVISETIVDISLGKETEKTKKRLELMRAKEERQKETAERKAKKLQEKIAKREKRLAEQRARAEKKIAEQQAKLQLNIAKFEQQSKELEKQKANL